MGSFSKVLSSPKRLRNQVRIMAILLIAPSKATYHEAPSRVKGLLSCSSGGSLPYIFKRVMRGHSFSSFRPLSDMKQFKGYKRYFKIGFCGMMSQPKKVLQQRLRGCLGLQLRRVQKREGREILGPASGPGSCGN